MKLKNMFAVAMAAVTLFSCTTEVTKYVEIEKPEGNTFLKLSLATADGLTRAGRDHYDGTPTEEELRIYNYAVFIFNSNGLLEATLTASPYSNGSGDFLYDRSYPLEFDPTIEPNNHYMDADGVITLTAGTKTFFALANAPADLLTGQNAFIGNSSLREADAKAHTLTLDSLQTIVGSYSFENGGGTFYDDPISKTGNRGFMMTSLDELYSRYFGEMEDTQEAISVPLEIGRAMCKTSLASDLEPRDQVTQPNGDFHAEEYKVVNNPKSMFVIPSVSGGVPLTPNFYSTDPVEPANYFPSTKEYINVSVQGDRTFSYFAENANLTPKKGNSTGVVVTGIYEPLSLVDGDGDNATDNYNNPNADGTFYRIRNTTTLEYESLYYHETPNAIGADQEVVEYEEGRCYYMVYLTNDNAPAPYCLKRNGYYKVDIKSVQGAGESNEGDLIPDPNEPIDPQTYITVEITVKDWDEVDVPGNL